MVSCAKPDMGDGLTRVSADAGEPVSYPYADELKACGDLATYELSFDVNSALLKNPTRRSFQPWPNS